MFGPVWLFVIQKLYKYKFKLQKLQDAADFNRPRYWSGAYSTSPDPTPFLVICASFFGASGFHCFAPDDLPYDLCDLMRVAICLPWRPGAATWVQLLQNGVMCSRLLLVPVRVISDNAFQSVLVSTSIEMLLLLS